VAEEGATVVTGGGVPEMPGELAEGCWVQPTIWTGLPETARVARRNLRPVLPHRTLRQRGRSARQGQRQQVRPGDGDLDDQTFPGRIASRRRWKSALCWVNSWFLRDLRTPFGGAKQSGIGREGGVHSLEFYTELKNVCIKLSSGCWRAAWKRASASSARRSASPASR
jgi:aminomuconate-semialdehyde/2-hydroxymuconate-6-semialdehyde dehydrogenase